MTSLLQTGLNGHLPAPTEKRFLISNTPEFDAGSHTFNEVFGLTRNPYDLSRSCGGSSGGAAVALGWSPDFGLFPVEMKWIREINGVPMESYIDWMQSCSLISLTEHPAMSVPCGFTPAGLPVGIQMVGRHRGERELLQLAHAFEQATGVGERRPEVALL